MLAVYIGFFAALVGVGVLLANPVTNQVQNFQQRRAAARRRRQRSRSPTCRAGSTTRASTSQVKTGRDRAADAAGQGRCSGSGDLVSFARDLLQRLVEASFALVLILVISVYMLVYGEQIGSARARA